MARELQIISTSDSSKYLLFGFNANELATFSIQMWITRTGKRAIDAMTALSLGYVSYMGGNIYIHNDDNANRGELFGEKKDMKIGVVVNEHPNLEKLFDSLGIHTDDDNWEVESITIAPNENYPDGMYSVLPKNHFVKRKGVLYSEFLRNMKSSNGTISYLEALSGEQLRGRTCYIVLKNTSTDRVELHTIEIEMTKSR